MSKELVCIVTRPEASALRSTLPLATLFNNHGYIVEYVGLFDGQSQQFIEAQGLRWNSFTGFDDFMAGKGKEISKLSRKELYQYQINWQKEVTQECYLYYQQSPPVLVLFEILNTTWAAPFVKLNVPLVAFSITLAATLNLSIPSVHSHLVPSQKISWRDRIKMFWNWAGLYKGYLISRIKFHLSLRAIFWNSIIPSLNLNEVFTKAGYKIKWGDYPGVDIRINVPTLYLCPKAFDFPTAEKIPNRVYVGTSVQLDRREGIFDWGKIHPGRKNIYSTLGSLSSYYPEKYRRNFYHSLIEAMKVEQGYNLILQIGNREDLQGIEIPENVYIYDWLPHMEIFKDIKLIICHAGLGTLREAIYHGIPSIVFPFGGDQPGNASRVVYHNLGVRGNFFTVTTADIIEKIRRIEKDTSIRSAVENFQQRFKSEKELTLGITFFERHMKKSNRNLIKKNVRNLVNQ